MYSKEHGVKGVDTLFLQFHLLNNQNRDFQTLKGDGGGGR